jgi:Alginate export
MNRWILGALALGAAALAPLARAADPPVSAAEQAQAANQEAVANSNFERQLDQIQYNSRLLANQAIPPDQRALLDYGAYATFSYLSVTDPTGNTHILRETDFVPYADVNLDNVQELFVRGRVTYRDYSLNDSFGGIDGTGEHSDLEQLYYKFDLQRYLAAYKGIATPNDMSVIAGRQTVIWGNGLSFNQDIDGAVFDATEGPFNLEVVGGVTVPDTIDFDTSRPGFNDRTERGFYGVLGGVQIEKNHPYLYFLDQRDYNSNRPLIVSTASGSIDTHFNYNSSYLGGGSNGSLSDRLLYGVEATAEFGDDLSNSYIRTPGGISIVPQHHENIEAYAADTRLDYVFPDPHNTRASGEFIMASGDHDRESTNNTFGGNRPGTPDLAYNGFGLLNTGLAFAPEVSNVLIYRIGASTEPLNKYDLFKKLEIGGDLFLFQKYWQTAPIDEPTGNGRYLGYEPDVYMNWQMTSDLTLAMRYGIFEPGQKILTSQKVRQLFYTGVTLAF